MKVSSVSVLVCTYNRAAMLAETLAAFQTMTPLPDCEVEIVVVDNNSSDGTREVVAEAASAGPFRVVALGERRQGKSFALNTGLAACRGEVIALTDDDVKPETDWVARLVDDFRTRDVTFVFGKVLPRWGTLPPPELLVPRAQDIWGPLAILDYGDQPADYLPESTSQRLPVGANLAFARTAIERIGGWRTDLGKVNNSLISGEDHEIFVRLRGLGLYAGYYDPALVVHHFVPPCRLTRRYFRRWFFWHGRTAALMLKEWHPELDLTRVPHIAGAPRFAYREALHQAWRWLRSRPGDALTGLIEELRLLQHAGLLTGCWIRGNR